MEVEEVLRIILKTMEAQQLKEVPKTKMEMASITAPKMEEDTKLMEAAKMEMEEVSKTGLTMFEALKLREAPQDRDGGGEQNNPRNNGAPKKNQGGA